MQETIRLQQMGRQNMIPRKIRLFETDNIPRKNGRYQTPPNPNPIYGFHLSVPLDIESYWSNIPPKL